MNGSRVCVLLVDDDEDDYVMTRDVLSEIEGQRFDLEWVATYEAALEAIETHRPDVCLVDYHLGAHNGLDLMREVLADGSTTPMILLTGQGGHEVDVEAMKSGAADYLVKGQIEAPLLGRSIRYALKRAQDLEALRESERFLQSSLDALSAYIAILDESGMIIAVNAAWQGFREGNPLIGAIHDLRINYLEVCESGFGERGREIAAGIREVIADQREAFYLEYPCECAGEPQWFVARVTRFTNKGVPMVVVAHDDITELKRTEEALQESEEQLRQSQKMEAIGRLAGGIAHDFNNLLVPITGYSDLLLLRLAEDDPMHRHAEQIKKSAERAATLTHQFLAFSRKQVLQPRVLNLNAVVTDMDKMLKRLIREDIEWVTLLDPDIGRVKADPGQIEQVIMNLTVNACDAMPEGGKLTIETANVELDERTAERHVGVQPGPYVMLVLSDTGCGMDEETRSQIFEPFFTTKDKSKGTGLGLSTVYGIVKQSGGGIWVYSELEKGSAFKVYLPRVQEVIESLGSGVSDTSLQQGSEVVLVVEDEPGVRELICEILSHNGYRILEACDGEHALRASRQHDGTIHLMVTDVVMPGMSGPELADRMRSERSDMKVLFMSGYTDKAIVHHGILDPGVLFLQKPFSPHALTRKLREVLDTPRQAERGS